ncbi:MAG TPA: ABC transporter ATP-binding protein [Longimicrobiales bacterium]|nr:ABC transporter ATP-binding protein [Longimicrobiales bacterium]
MSDAAEGARAPLLVVEGLTRWFDGGAVHALSGVSFQAAAGEVVAITGPSGCGKSTLLALVGLLDQPTSGRIVIGGQDLAHVSRPSAFRARRIGFVFQFHHLVPTMTLGENVAAPMIPLGVPRRQRTERARELLDRMRLSHRAAFLPANVSGGERQRAAVARALVNDPPVILADEPTGNLDSRNGQVVVDLMVEHARAQGALVLVATHNPEVARVAGRHIELLDGQLVRPSTTP